MRMVPFPRCLISGFTVGPEALAGSYRAVPRLVIQHKALQTAIEGGGFRSMMPVSSCSLHTGCAIGCRECSSYLLTRPALGTNTADSKADLLTHTSSGAVPGCVYFSRTVACVLAGHMTSGSSIFPVWHSGQQLILWSATMVMDKARGCHQAIPGTRCLKMLGRLPLRITVAQVAHVLLSRVITIPPCVTACHQRCCLVVDTVALPSTCVSYLGLVTCGKANWNIDRWSAGVAWRLSSQGVQAKETAPSLCRACSVVPCCYLPAAL